MTPRAALLALVVATACGGGIDELDLERMKDQAKGEPFEYTPHFADGRVMQHPPAGTVPRARPNGPRELLEGTTPDGAPVAKIPLPLTRPLLVRGRDRYNIYCAPCHGLRGDGESEVARNMMLRRPPPLHEFGLHHPPGEIYRVITQGYGLMPPYANELGVTDRWAVIAYLKALAISQGVPLDALPPGARDEVRSRLP